MKLRGVHMIQCMLLRSDTVTDTSLCKRKRVSVKIMIESTGIYTCLGRYWGGCRLDMNRFESAVRLLACLQQGMGIGGERIGVSPPSVEDDARFGLKQTVGTAQNRRAKPGKDDR